MNRHPIVRIYDVLNKNDELAKHLKSMKGPRIFNFKIPENYQKAEYTPVVRITEILLTDTLYRDGDSANYRFLFAVETLGTNIANVYSISELIEEIIKSINGRCYKRDLLEDEKLGLFNQMLEFEIILPKKEK